MKYDLLITFLYDFTSGSSLENWWTNFIFQKLSTLDLGAGSFASFHKKWCYFWKCCLLQLEKILFKILHQHNSFPMTPPLVDVFCEKQVTLNGINFSFDVCLNADFLLTSFFSVSKMLIFFLFSNECKWMDINHILFSSSKKRRW